MTEYTKAVLTIIVAVSLAYELLWVPPIQKIKHHQKQDRRKH